MQTASYITALFNKTTPEEAPHPQLFEFFETLLDYAEAQGGSFSFLIWAELQFCNHHGHAPNLGNCTLCNATKNLSFSALSGGMVCAECAQEKKLLTLSCSLDVLDILRAWQSKELPHAIDPTSLTAKQKTAIHTIMDRFMRYHFNLPPELRNAVLH